MQTIFLNMENEMSERIYKEYDDAAARAGARVGCRDARYVPDILKRVDGAIFGTIVTASGDRDELPVRWNASGMTHITTPGPHDLVLLPSDIVDGRPVWHGGVKAWPTTTMATAALLDLGYEIVKKSQAGGMGAGYIELASAIIAHECEAGTVIPVADLPRIVRIVLSQFDIFASGHALVAMVDAARRAP